MSLNRRGFLSSTALMALAPQLSFAQAQTDRRFIFIIQRGAADGLNTVIPYADPAYAKLRGARRCWYHVFPCAGGFYECVVGG